MALLAVGAAVADVAVVVGETASREPMHRSPGPAVVERSRGPVTLNTSTRCVTGAARLGIKGRGHTVPAQPPERSVALGWMRAMAIDARRRGVAVGAGAALGAGLIFVPWQIGVRAQPALVVVARFQGSARASQATEAGGGVTLAALGPGCPAVRIRVAFGASLPHQREPPIERGRRFLLGPTDRGR